MEEIVVDNLTTCGVKGFAVRSIPEFIFDSMSTNQAFFTFK